MRKVRERGTGTDRGKGTTKRDKWRKEGRENKGWDEGGEGEGGRGRVGPEGRGLKEMKRGGERWGA